MPNCAAARRASCPQVEPLEVLMVLCMVCRGSVGRQRPNYLL